MTTNKANCVKVLGIAQGKPKPKKQLRTTEVDPLAATGVDGAWPFALSALAAAAVFGRRVRQLRPR
jgi:hypothetical protein